jgi:hypothetical protein
MARGRMVCLSMPGSRHCQPGSNGRRGTRQSSRRLELPPLATHPPAVRQIEVEVGALKPLGFFRSQPRGQSRQVRKIRARPNSCGDRAAKIRVGKPHSGPNSWLRKAPASPDHRCRQECRHGRLRVRATRDTKFRVCRCCRRAYPCECPLCPSRSAACWTWECAPGI